MPLVLPGAPGSPGDSAQPKTAAVGPVMRRAGFTLIEVMIAMFIAAIMFAIGYRTLNQAMIERDSLKTAQDRVTEIQRGMRIVAQDFAQIAARAARDTAGHRRVASRPSAPPGATTP